MTFMNPCTVANETSEIVPESRNDKIAEFTKFMQQGCAISRTKPEKTQRQMGKQTQRLPGISQPRWNIMVFVSLM